MGTFLGYYGGAGIPKDRLEEFTQRVMKILDHGGMMQAEDVFLFGRRIFLLHSPEMDIASQNVLFSYNYFENENWETACYHAGSGGFVTGKVGTRHFNAVCCAVYVLAEFYDSEFRISEEDGRVYDAAYVIGWLNALFGEQYTNARLHDPWKIYTMLPDDCRYDDLLRLVDFEEAERQSEDGVIRYLASLDHNAFQKALQNGKGSYQYSVAKFLALMRKGADELMEMNPQADLDTFKRIIAGEDAPEAGNAFASVCKLLPREYAVKFVADAFEMDFMKLWAEMKPRIRVLSDHTDARSPFPPVKPRSTAEFLNRADDDRAWWWRPEGDVHFSQEMEDWLCELKRELDELASNERVSSGDFIRLLVETLYEVQNKFPRTAAFRDMFYEFLTHPDDAMIQASIRLLGRLKDRYLAEDTPDGFQRLRRYLAVLGNRELRKVKFGF